MKALVYHGPGKKAWEERTKPLIKEQTDAVVKILKTKICGTDLHIMKGDVTTVTDGRIIGHEEVGIIDEAGYGVTKLMAPRRNILEYLMPTIVYTQFKLD